MFYRFFTTSALAGTLYLSSFSAIQAATINIMRSDSKQFESTYGMHSDTGTVGYDLGGALVTAKYSDGTSEELVWEADLRTWTRADGSTYGSNKGWARGTNIDLFQSWSGFEMTTTSLLRSLTIDLAPASAVFDTKYIFDDDPDGGSTEGSKHGFAFQLYGGSEAVLGAITASYSGIVNLAGADAVGDIYTTMTVDFSLLAAGGILGDLYFQSDIDRLAVAGDLSPVPLPMSLSFLLLGLGGLGLTRGVSKRRS